MTPASVVTRGRAFAVGLLDRYRLVRSRVIKRAEAQQAVAYWSSLSDCESYENDPIGAIRSRWLAEEVVQEFGVTSLLEVGVNSGRNLAHIRAAYPEMPLRGIDINARAIKFAQGRHPGIEFAVADAHHWPEAPSSWDAVLTMSVLDHIPNDAVESVARAMVGTAKRYVICVELWDGEDAVRGPYKYSRDTRLLFERLGAQTIRWEESPGQYDPVNSLLWVYVGAV
jgi:Methyltransferase domain